MQTRRKMEATDTMTNVFRWEKPRLEKVAQHSMKDEIVDRFLTLIASGALAVGDNLPSERELATSMGVSRETVRGALLILSIKGIVSIAQGARTKVISDDVGISQLTLKNVAQYTLEDVHDVRIMAERRIAERLIDTTDLQTIERLSILIETQEEIADDPVQFLMADREFHTTLYDACGNAALADLATTYYSYQLNHRRRAIVKPGAIAQSINDHRNILLALKAGDLAALIAALGVHETRIYESTRQLMGNSK